MITYDRLVQETLERFPKVKERYNLNITRNMIDRESGPHTVFSCIFNPTLLEAMEENMTEAKAMFDYLEEMEKSGSDVAEVCEFTVLEELCDEYPDDKLMQIAGTETKLAINSIREYIPE